MLYWALLFFIFSVLAGIMGFGEIAVASADMAQILFYIFIGLFVFSLLSHAVRSVDKKVNTNLKH